MCISNWTEEKAGSFLQKTRRFSEFVIIAFIFPYKKPGKIYCCSTFRAHHYSIIKRLVKQHANKERYRISINYNKRPKQTPWCGWNPFARSMLVYACECITFL